jgi:hypothetical protein
VAVIASVPTGNVVRVKLAVPDTRLRVPSAVVPLWKVTVPVGTVLPPEALVTEAVNVRDWPNVDGLALPAPAMTTEVLLLARLTVCDRLDGEELLVKSTEPL